MCLNVSTWSTGYVTLWITSFQIVITICIRYYKVLQILLQSTTGITKCDSYYKVRRNSTSVSLLEKKWINYCHLLKSRLRSSCYWYFPGTIVDFDSMMFTQERISTCVDQCPKKSSTVRFLSIAAVNVHRKELKT